MTENNRVKTMSSRDRVLAALKGGPVDRLPVMYWLNPHMTCKILAQRNSYCTSRSARFFANRWLRFEDSGGLSASEWTRLLPLAAEEYGNGELVLDLGADIGFANPLIVNPLKILLSIRKSNGRLRFKGPFGTTLGVGGIYADVIEHPVSSAAELKNFCFPKVKKRHFDPIRRYREKHPDICIFSEALAFQQAVCDYILGAENFMFSLYDHPQELKDFFHRFADWIAEIIRFQGEAGADVAFLQDDYGSNGSPLISLDMWQELTLPHLRRFIETAHNADMPLVLHSCGYQMDFLPYYVEAGLDGLQSFQPTAGNDFAKAYSQYGDQLTFLTGIDILAGESMTPAELKASIHISAETGSIKNRFILGMTHMLQYTMSEANIDAILETVKQVTSINIQQRTKEREYAGT